MLKDAKIEIRISEEDKLELQKILKPQKISISAFLRNFIQNYIKERKENATKNK